MDRAKLVELICLMVRPQHLAEHDASDVAFAVADVLQRICPREHQALAAMGWEWRLRFEVAVIEAVEQLKIVQAKPIN